MRRAWLAGVLACSACAFTPSATSDATAVRDTNAASEASAGTDSGPVIDAPPKPLDAYAGPPEFVQASVTSPNWGSNDTVITSAAIATAPGDLIALYITYADSNSVSVKSVTDTAGNTYTIKDTADDGGDGQQATTAYAENIAGGSIVITATLTHSECCRLMIAHEVRGIATTNALDTSTAHHQGSPGTSTDDVDSGSKSTSTSGDYVFAGTSNSSGAGGMMITAGTGETLRTNVTPPGGNATATEDEIQATSGSIQSTFTFSKNADALTAEMAFKPANPE